MVLWASSISFTEILTMYTGFLHLHSALRYFVLILLIVVIARAMMGWLNSRPYVKWDNKFSLWLLIATHLQVVVGLILYFVSPFVQFNGQTMKDATTRYWTVEHVFGMIIAVALITGARSSHKKLATDAEKHKRLFILNLIALAVIVAVLIFSGRGILRSSVMS
jgi:hypothetical protein